MQRHIDLEWKHVMLRNSDEKPCKRWGHRCLVIGQEVVIFGGFDTSYMNDLWVFDIGTMTWRLLTTGGDEQLKRSNFSMNYDLVNDRIVVYGGKLPDKKICNSIWLLEWRTKEWWQLQHSSGPAPEERKYHTAEIMFPYFLVYAGEASTDLDDLWVYNFLTLSWTEVHPEGPKPRARRFHSSVLLGNTMYVMGGCYNKYEPLNDMWAMDLSSLESGSLSQLVWRQVELCGNYLPRWGHSSTTKDGKIYIFGGKIAQDVRNDLYVIDPAIRSVNVVPTKNEPSHRRRHTSVFFGRTLLVFGGFNGNYFDDFYCLTLNVGAISIPPAQLARDMEDLVNNAKFEYSVLTTSDTLRLYVHRSILRRKLGSDADVFLQQLETITLKEATKSLKEVYTGLDFSLSLDKLKAPEAQQPYAQRLLSLEGVPLPANLSEKCKEGVIQLAPQHWQKLVCARHPAHEDPSDVLTVETSSPCRHTNLTLAKARSPFFEYLFEFKPSAGHRPPGEFGRLVPMLLKYLEHDYAIVPSSFSVFDWFDLFMVGKYYNLERLARIALYQVASLIDEANLHRVWSLATINRVPELEAECAQWEVMRAQTDCKEQPQEPREDKDWVRRRMEFMRHAVSNELQFYISQNILKNFRENPEKNHQQ